MIGLELRWEFLGVLGRSHLVRATARNWIGSLRSSLPILFCVQKPLPFAEPARSRTPYGFLVCLMDETVDEVTVRLGKAAFVGMWGRKRRGTCLSSTKYLPYHVFTILN